MDGMPQDDNGRSTVTTTHTVMPDGSTKVESVTKTINPDGSETEEIETWFLPPGHGADFGRMGADSGAGAEAYRHPPAALNSPQLHQQPMYAQQQQPAPQQPSGGGGGKASGKEADETQESGGGDGKGGNGGGGCCGPRAKKIWIAAIVLVVLAGIAVGVAVPLTNRKKNRSNNDALRNGETAAPASLDVDLFSGPDGACDLDGNERECVDVIGTDLELCFDEDSDRSKCHAFVVDNADNDFSYCCQGCAVCPPECENENAYDCTNLDNAKYFKSCECPDGMQEPALGLFAKSGGLVSEGQEGTCDLDGKDKECFGNGDGSFELCFDENVDRSKCNSFVVDTSRDNYSFCCNGCAVCPSGCKYKNAYDCTNLGAELVGLCDCPDGNEPQMSDLVASGLSSPAPTPTQEPTPTDPVLPTMQPNANPNDIESLCAIDGGVDVFCTEIPDSSMELCLDQSSDLKECSLWFRDLKSGNDLCCQGCTICPPECENNFSFDCENLSDGAVDECNCTTTPPTLPPTPAPTVSSPVGSESEQITSVCELDGGSFASCDPLPDLPSLEVCIDLDASLDECNFWLRNATTGEDFCCRGCDVCPPGCTSTFSFDCGNILDNTTFPCDCPPTPSPPSETVSAMTPSVVPTARPTSLPTSAFVPAPSSAGLESICMIDGGRDAFCSPLEGTTLATCVDYNSLFTECSMWIRELDLSVDICCEECSVCPPGCDNTLAWACETVAEGASLDCGFCP